MKNRVLRSTLVVILVIAMVLTMTACDNTTTVDPTAAPVVTAAPATETPAAAATETPVATETPSVTVTDTDEAALAIYGITFPEFDSLVYCAEGDDDYDTDDMYFYAKIDNDNIYQEAYTFEIKASVSGTDHEGKSISSSKIATSGSKSATWTEGSSKLGFTAVNAGIYTVEYTVTVEHDKDDEYGYYAPGEVDEEYTITKTYTVEKAELELKTSSDAFQVSDDMFFVDSTISYSDDEKLAFITDGEYSTSVNVTSCDGTEVGEYTLAITIYDEDDEAVEADEIVLSNYYVTVNEGTRYILSEEEVAKVNAIRTMASIDGAAQYTTEYSLETITYYNTLTAGQKVMAKVDIEDSWTSRGDAKLYSSNYYLVTNIAISSDDVAEAQYNMDRDGIIDAVEDAIDAYMTAATDTKKDAALTTLAELLLNINNEDVSGEEYGSDLLYILGGLATGYVDNGEYVAFADEDVDYADFELDNGAQFAIIEQGSITEYILVFAVAYDDDDETYVADFSYGLDITEVPGSGYTAYEDYGYSPVVNEVYDEYVTDYLDYLVYLMAEYYKVVEDQAIAQADIDKLEDALDDVIDAYEALIVSYQLDIEIADTSYAEDALADYDLVNASDLEEAYDDITDAVEKIVARWDAYIALIDAYGFESTYIDNADQEDLAATYMAMYALLGYNFANGELASVVVVDGSYKTDSLYYTVEVGDETYYAYAMDYTYDEWDDLGELASAGDWATDAFYYDKDGVLTIVTTVTTHSYYTETLSNALFAYTDIVTDEVVYATPDLFVDGALAAAETLMQVAMAVQAEVDAYKTDLLQYLVSTNEYSAIYSETASSHYDAINGALLGTDTSLDDANGNATPALVYAKAMETTLYTTGQYDTTGQYTTGQYAENLADIYSYIDAVVAMQALDSDSDFYDTLEDDGLDAAISEMFEDIIEDTQEHIDDMVDSIDDGKVAFSEDWSGEDIAAPKADDAYVFSSIIDSESVATDDIESVALVDGEYSITRGTTVIGKVTVGGGEAVVGMNDDYDLKDSDSVTISIEVTMATDGSYAYLDVVAGTVTFTYTAE